jgi:C1A family cysteine protease
MIYQIVVLIAFLAVSSAKLFPEKASHQKYLWESFKRDFGKSYETQDEETKRFNYFLENLKIADLRNEAERRAGGSAVHGITKFSDLSQSEFEAKYLKADVTKKSNNAEVVTITVAPTASLVDWSGVLTTPVKDQGYCGSCWAFSATEQIESDAIRTLGTTYILSPEQIVQCDSTSYGCSGGWTENAYNYVKKNGGITTEANYPYTSYMGTTGQCKTGQSNVITVSSYYTISTESSMATYVQSTGPLSVCLDANNWSSYTGGIMSVCGHSVDHCVQAVGVYPATSGGYWKLRNSWGTSWGESGYIRLSYGSNTCSITNDPTYVSLKTV